MNQDGKTYVAGVVNIDPKVSGSFPHTFFELDTTDINVRDKVLGIYKKYNLDVVEHRIGKGWHFFGNKVDRQIWIEWYSELKDLNPLYPPLTLRISKKFPTEVYERPIYHEAQEVVPNWSRSLMSFMNKVIRGENSTNLWSAINHVGLTKWFKCVVYPVEVKIQ